MTRIRLINWWISRKWDALHLFFGLCGLAICLTGEMAGFPELARQGEWGIGILLLVHMVHAVLHHLDAYLKQIEEVDLVPAFQMKQVTGFYLILFLLAFVLTAWLGRYLPWKTFGGLAWRVIVTVIRGIVGFFSGKPVEIVQDAFMKPETAAPLVLPSGETSLFARIFDHILTGVFWLASAVVLTMLLGRIILAVSRWLGTLHLDGDEKKFLVPGQDQISRLEMVNSERQHDVWQNRLCHVMDRSVNGRVRARYRYVLRNRLLQKSVTQIRGNMTPEETEFHAGFAREDVRRLRMHELYEKARYSEHGCEREELEEMKRLP